MQAYELAKADAQKFLEHAKVTSFETAAVDIGKSVFTTGLFSLDPRTPLQGYTLSSRSMPPFIRAASAMIGELARNKGATPPTQLVELPPDAKVAAAQLLAVESRLSGIPVEIVQDHFYGQLLGEYYRMMRAEWFDYDSILARTGYQDLTGSRKSGSPQQQQRASAE
jgi:hypothetical protein